MTIPGDVKAVLDEAVETVPVNPAHVARKLGLEVYSAELPKNISGMLKRDETYGTPSGFVIFVNKNEPAVRQRFTAAHEIAHFALHKESIGHEVSDNYMLRSEGMSDRQEVEANKFAAAMLMPMDKVNSAIKQGITTPEALAKKFNVSKVAMSIRLGLPT